MPPRKVVKRIPAKQRITEPVGDARNGALPVRIVEHAVVSRPIAGSLPMQLRISPNGAGAVESLPAVLCAPAHLRSTTGSGASVSKGAVGTTSYAATGVPAAKPKKAKKDKHDNGHGRGDPHHDHDDNDDNDDHDDQDEDDGDVSDATDGESTPFPIMDAQGFLDLAEGMLDPESDGAAGRIPGAASAASASYDFDEYVLLRNPDDPYAEDASFNTGGRAIPADPRFQRFCDEARNGIGEFCGHSALGLPYTPALASLIESLKQMVYGWWYSVCAVRAFNRLQTYSNDPVPVPFNHTVTVENFYGYCLGTYLMNRYDAVSLAYYTGGGYYLDAAPLVKVAVWEAAVNGVFDDHFGGVNLVDPTAPKDDYIFEPFSTNEILYGIRVVHRQDWRRLGYARGELVKSIPLGPREVQRVSVKVNTRRKVARTSEEATSFETSSEATNTNRNTTEVVDEASQKFNQHADASLGGGYAGIIEAKISAGISQDMASSSKQTKTRLNELMDKTASRMKRDTKVTVSTESETTFEDTRASEITNPNDELGITYLYYRLQLRYWVTMEMAEVQSVVFVPQPVPAWRDVTEAWVREHADAILRVLLDPSFAPVIAAIRQEPATLAYQPAPIFSQAASASIQATALYQRFTGGGDMPDLLSSGQEFYARDYERRANLRIEQDRRAHQTAAFLTHLRRNILHYMRAIWSEEDYDQRMQRYSRMRVPVSWYFVPLTPPTAGTPTALEVDGIFVPDGASARPLTDVLDPIGPIGYYLNGAIYRLRDDSRLANLHQALAYLRSAYTRFAVTTQVTSAAVTVRHAVAFAPRSFSADYTIQYGAASHRWLYVIPGRPESTWPQVTVMPDGSLDALGIRMWLDGTPAAGDRIVITLRVTEDLEDPYLKLLMTRHPLPPTAQEPALFSDALLGEMARTFAELEGIDGKSWTALTLVEKAAVRAHYHLFLMFRDTGRLVTIDTPNLVLDLEGSRSPALEPFKRLHRYVDVLKEFEEMRRRSFDNRRRNDLIDDGELGDPDIERVTLIGGPKMLNGIIPIDDSPED